MRLYEWEAKALIAPYGISVPRGAVWPASPPIGGALVAKAQTLGGRRGLRGGIAFCDGASVAVAVESLVGATIGDEIVESVYVEERLGIVRELYVAVVTDRDAGGPALLLSRHGGVHIEAHAGTVVSLPLTNLRIEPPAVLELAQRAGLDGPVARALVPVAQALWTCYQEEEAELIEINPLVETADGRLVAADARIALDDNASSRHPGRPAGGYLGTRFERRCADLGAVGIEMDGGIAAIVSGAGLMMATIDMLVDAGGSVRAAVDLGGLVLREADELSGLIEAVGDLRPRALLINAFFQLATCDALARKLAAGLERRPLGIPIVARLRGRGLEEARTILDRHGVVFEQDLQAACSVVISAARGPVSGRSPEPRPATTADR